MAKTPVSLAARERLRDHQAAAAKAVSAHSAAQSHLQVVIARRNEVSAAQDRLVAAAEVEVAAAVATVARVMGTEVAATLLDLSKTEIRRLLKSSQLGAD